MKKILSYSLTLLLLHVLTTAQATDQDAIEKRKSWVKVYTVQRGEMLSVDNQYGQVKVNLWDRNEIRIDIRVTASATTERRATDYLDAVSITEKRAGSVISLRTDIDRDQFGSNTWNSLAQPTPAKELDPNRLRGEHAQKHAADRQEQIW